MTEKSEEEDGGYTFSLAKGLRKRSASEADEDRYLAEQEGKELSEKRIFQNRIRKQDLKDVGRAAAGAVFSGLVEMGRREVDVGKKVGRYVASTEAAKYAGARLKGAVGYIPSKFEQAKLDYEANIEAEKAFKEAKREGKVDKARTRGRSAEQREYRKSQGKDAESVKRKEIELEALKSYRKERARAMGRREVAQLDSIRKGQQIQPIQVQPQFGVPPQRQARQWARPRFGTGYVRQPTAQELDPFGIYSLRGMQSGSLNAILGYVPRSRLPPQEQERIPSEERVEPQPRPIIRKPSEPNTSSFVNTFLNLNAPMQGNPNGKKKANGKRKKVWSYNYSTFRYEWM